MTKARDIADFKFENITDTGTAGTKIASGTTAQRGSTQGQLRYNTQTNSFEFRDNSGTSDFLSAPVISSLDNYDVDTDAGGDITFAITGKNFVSGAVVYFIANDGTSITSSSTTVNSATQITAVVARSNFSNANEPYDVKIINGNALQAISENIVNVDNDPVWQTGATLTTIYQNLSYNISFSATDSDGDTVTYSHISGTLPSGMTFSGNQLSGTAPVVAGPTTYTFTIRATANSKTADRLFTLVVDANSPPVWQTAAGSLGTVYDTQRSDATTLLTQPTATDYQGETITYTVVSGSLPTGLTLNSNGSWSGTPNAEVSDTTYTFTIAADDGVTSATNRQFTITVNAPSVVAFSTVGSGTWTSPLTANISILVIGAAGGYGYNSGSGGAGGIVYHNSYSVTSGTTYDYEVGMNGNEYQNINGGTGKNGGSSKFGISGDSAELIALGGGGGMHPSGTYEMSAGAANEGSYMGNVGSQVQGCYKPTASLGTQQGVGATIYGGYRAGTSNMQHYAWDTAGSAGAGGNGSSSSFCGGNSNGGVGIDFSSTEPLFAAYSNDSGYFAGGDGRGNSYGSTAGVDGAGFNSYGGANPSTRPSGVVLLKL